MSSREGTALQADADYRADYTGDSLDREERSALRRVPNLTTELDDITEVEYRQLRLENVILVGVWTSGTVEDAEVSLRELAALAETAGSVVRGGVLQRRAKPDNATYLGSGKAKELAQLVAETGADTVIVDTELSPNQRRNLEDVAKVKVIDRTTLILDIFAQHAKSREGKAQVELAQLEYLLPRLRGWGESMSRQAGGRVGSGDGIGARGPGETQIELDRRRIHQRMAKLKRDIAAMEPARRTQRSNRRRNALPSVVVVGYTNAGKSSLMNRLTDAGVLVENALFATLDPTVRRSATEDGRVYTISDTVGFVRSLPTQLVEAFRSTLEEAAEADLLLHVVDASHPDPVGQVDAVHAVLADVEGAEDVHELIILSKSDLADPVDVAALRSRYPGSVVVSAKTGEGIELLRSRIAELLPRPSVKVDVTVPFDRGDLISRAHTEGEILSEEYSEDGTVISALVDPELAADLRSAGD
ncbi:GTPase HflX [Flaviflexus salsibiostraticola]|uniref:GTPase HflX n=1 Tax=Flaviflexus salsibiostraticola TaxID=1282737 RepID=A0A3S8Z606_9ACTO|nr:GTPase HflX [Flaviflexus salsibiostraticola]AZN28927.1 GTPase HflX [Flaviflexus salsibiostraticola]